MGSGIRSMNYYPYYLSSHLLIWDSQLLSKQHIYRDKASSCKHSIFAKFKVSVLFYCCVYSYSLKLYKLANRQWLNNRMFGQRHLHICRTNGNVWWAQIEINKTSTVGTVDEQISTSVNLKVWLDISDKSYDTIFFFSDSSFNLDISSITCETE